MNRLPAMSEIYQKVKKNAFYKRVIDVYELESFIIAKAIQDNRTPIYSIFDKNGECLYISYEKFEIAVVGGLALTYDSSKSNTRADSYYLKMIGYDQTEGDK